MCDDSTEPVEMISVTTAKAASQLLVALLASGKMYYPSYETMDQFGLYALIWGFNHNNGVCLKITFCEQNTIVVEFNDHRTKEKNVIETFYSIDDRHGHLCMPILDFVDMLSFVEKVSKWMASRHE